MELRSSDSEGNLKLAAAISESGLSNRELAKWVIRMGNRGGIHLGTTHTAVTRWLEGVQPRWPVPKIVAETLSIHLGYDVSPSDLGFTRGPTARASAAIDTSVPWTLAEATRSTIDLTDHDMKRRSFLMGAAFAAGLYAQPVLFWATSGAEKPVLPSVHTTEVNTDDAVRITSKVRTFRSLDYQIGGNETRELVVGYLNRVVRTKVGGTYDPDTGTLLYRAVAQLAEHAAWASFDSGRDALAQHYFVRALRFAQAGDDASYGAHIVASMSCQAAHLGHGHEAVQLARAAIQRTEEKAPKRLLTLLHLMAARGHAVLGDEGACTESLQAAENSLSGSAMENDPEWIAFLAEATLAHWFAQCYIDLGKGRVAERYAKEALSYRLEPGPLCRRVQETAFIAIAQAQVGEIDGACVTGEAALREARRISSPNTLSHLARLRDTLNAHASARVVQTFNDQANLVLGPPAQAASTRRVFT